MSVFYKGVALEDSVFCRPSCVFTNVNNPAAEIERKMDLKKLMLNEVLRLVQTQQLFVAFVSALIRLLMQALW